MDREEVPEVPGCRAEEAVVRFQGTPWQTAFQRLLVAWPASSGTLAAELGVSRATVRRWRNGESRPSLAQVCEAGSVLTCRLDSLTRWTTELQRSLLRDTVVQWLRRQADFDATIDARIAS